MLNFKERCLKEGGKYSETSTENACLIKLDENLKIIGNKNSGEVTVKVQE